MTELEQYKKAYATLVGKIDKNITILKTGREAFKKESEDLAQTGGLFMDTLIGALQEALQEAEEIFLAEDPEE